MKRLLWALPLLAGCTLPAPAPPADPGPGPGYYRAVIAAAVALTPPAQAPPDQLNEHARTDCPGQGWVTHGDGHRTRCPNCRPVWPAEQETPAPGPPALPPPARPAPEPEQKPAADPACPTGTCPAPIQAAPIRVYRRGIFGWRYYD